MHEDVVKLTQKTPDVVRGDGCDGQAPAVTAQHCEQRTCAPLDRALVLLLDHEESILGSIVTECSDLVRLADEQAVELAEYLEEQG